MLASSLLLYSRYFFVAIGVTLPVGITIADEIGLAAKINGVSMRPSFNPVISGKKRRWWQSDVVWVNRWNRGIPNGQQGLKAGDVVALYSPVDTGSLLIKRVIGTPGDKIRVRGCGSDITVPPCHYWVEGDNDRTGASEDSNYFGPVSEGLVLGLVTRLLWPLHRWQQVSKELTSEQRNRIGIQ